MNPVSTTSKAKVFLGTVLQLVIDAGAVSDSDFFKVANPKLLAQELKSHPEERGHILHAASGLELEQGQEQEPLVVQSLLTSALKPRTQVSTDPTNSKPTLIRVSISFDDWARILPDSVLWLIIWYGSWFNRQLNNIDELLVQIIQHAFANGLLTPTDIIRAIGVNELVDALMRASISGERAVSEKAKGHIRSLLVLALTNGLTNGPLTSDDTLDQIPPEELIKIVGRQVILEKVFGFIAKENNLVEKPNGIPQLSARSDETPSAPNVTSEPQAEVQS